MQTFILVVEAIAVITALVLLWACIVGAIRHDNETSKNLA